jgi:cathepsin C
VSCSVYNQGCDGGYPLLVSKHGQDYGLVPSNCMPYTGTDGECKLTGSGCDSAPRYFVSDYRYIGGYYGACNEEAMMREVYHNGPIVIAFEVLILSFFLFRLLLLFV